MNFKQFLSEALLKVRKEYPGGHVGHFDVDDRGSVTMKMVPKGREPEDVDFGMTFDKSEMPPHISAAWLKHIQHKLLPRARNLADKTGHALIASPASDRLNHIYSHALPAAGFERREGKGIFSNGERYVYKPDNGEKIMPRKQVLRLHKDLERWHRRIKRI